MAVRLRDAAGGTANFIQLPISAHAGDLGLCSSYSLLSTTVVNTGRAMSGFQRSDWVWLSWSAEDMVVLED